jgi:hypothetical protein
VEVLSRLQPLVIDHQLELLSRSHERDRVGSNVVVVLVVVVVGNERGHRWYMHVDVRERVREQRFENRVINDRFGRGVVKSERRVRHVIER